MRWLFLLVLSLNLAYIAWEMNRPASEVYAGAKAIKNTQPILLLSEIESQQLASLSENTPKSLTAKTLDDQSELATVSQTGTETQHDAAEIMVDQVVFDTEMNESGESETGGKSGGQWEFETVQSASSESEEAKSVDAALAQAEQLPAKSVRPESIGLNDDVRYENDSCFTLGPFRDLEVLRGLTREIKSYVVAVDYRGREVNEQSLYWVYIKPVKNRKAAIATGKRLKAKNIKDYYVIRDGEKVNGVSLGYFRNKDGAYGLVDKVKKLGFDVVLEPVYKTYTVYWMDYQVHDEASVPQSIFDKYLEAARKDKITRLTRDCAV